MNFLQGLLIIIFFFSPEEPFDVFNIVTVESIRVLFHYTRDSNTVRKRFKGASNLLAMRSLIELTPSDMSPTTTNLAPRYSPRSIPPTAIITTVALRTETSASIV